MGAASARRAVTPNSWPGEATTPPSTRCRPVATARRSPDALTGGACGVILCWHPVGCAIQITIEGCFLHLKDGPFSTSGLTTDRVTSTCLARSSDQPKSPLPILCQDGNLAPPRFQVQLQSVNGL